ncbi:2-hydroxyglutaryl-CoA dehydratase [Caloramator sp. E03]|uniref:acyl-CoA dehydratase activase-related protein n=1 Tax=Caloramator sp. E03 TaxID=2576307 RepID=UPI0011106707|nr:acyl-CoA dehydratase activase-related protein [Caloramator sp. E03]QCX34554.1 2-hydroxyglutaryl-CoA dehydratase [Caloramator sp. E03]
MRIGIPKGLLYYRYYPFIESFFYELGCEIVTSGDTNKEILDGGVKYCVDEACLPIKVFHGHVLSIKDKCDMLFIPRIMRLYKNEFICPKFCGLPEMIKHSIPNLPLIIGDTLYADSKYKLKSWAFNVGKNITNNRKRIDNALKVALESQKQNKKGIMDKDYELKVALVGHPYNIYDSFINMNVIKKLNNLKVGVTTEERLNEEYINSQISILYKKPFWTFARNSYGFSTYMAENMLIDGIIYVSSFACGIDSVVVELIKNRIRDFPMLVLKIDEHTGEAGFDTRIEAFVDMLERRSNIENNFSASW